MIEVNKLRTVNELKGKIVQLFSNEEILEMVSKKLIPHYILTNPISHKTTALFDVHEINNWLSDNTQKEGIVLEHELHFHCFDPRHFHIDDTDNVPVALGRIKRLYKLTKQHHSTPHGIYFLCKEHEVVYVGQAKNISARVGDHRADTSKEFDSVYFIVCHIDQLDSIERALIRHLQPVYNLQRHKLNAQNDHLILQSLGTFLT